MKDFKEVLPEEYPQLVSKLRQKIRTQAKRLRLLQQYRNICDQMIYQYEEETSQSLDLGPSNSINKLPKNCPLSKCCSISNTSCVSSRLLKKTSSQLHCVQNNKKSMRHKASDYQLIINEKKKLEKDYNEAIQILEQAQGHLNQKDKELEKMGSFIQQLIMKLKVNQQLNKKIKQELKKTKKENKTLQEFVKKKEEEKGKFLSLLQFKEQKLRKSFDQVLNLQNSLRIHINTIQTMKNQLKTIQVYKQKVNEYKNALQNKSKIILEKEEVFLELEDKIFCLTEKIHNLQTQNYKLQRENLLFQESSSPISNIQLTTNFDYEMNFQSSDTQNQLLKTLQQYFEQCTYQIKLLLSRFQFKNSLSVDFLSYVSELENRQINLLEWIVRSGKELQELSSKISEEEITSTSRKTGDKLTF